MFICSKLHFNIANGTLGNTSSDIITKIEPYRDGWYRCTYIDPTTNKRCALKLGLYPRYCELHTMLIQNVYISKSHIKAAGNGLYAGPYGFKKGDVIFWKGHVAMCIDSKELIHAYGPEKKVLIMPIIKTIERIERTASLSIKKISSIRY